MAIPKRRVLYFFPHNPYPPQSGAHRRCLEMLTGLSQLGYDVIFASSVTSSETSWNIESQERLRDGLAFAVEVYEPGRIDRTIIKTVRGWHRRFTVKHPISSIMFTPPRMRIWFWQLYRRYKPDIVIISYTFWDGLATFLRRRGVIRIIDSLDLIAFQNVMRKKLLGSLPRKKPIIASTVDLAVLEEDFFDLLPALTLEAEFQTFDRYDYTIAISQPEHDLIAKNTLHTQAVYIPMTQDVGNIVNTYSGPALFTTGPNPFNLQGYLYFVRKVLPLVHEVIPAFMLCVTGAVCREVVAEEGVILSGYIYDLDPVFASARFAICPILGKTGQQIKIIEAMAHGLAVVALEAAAQGSPIRHGENGFVAANSTEFADYVIRLWNDSNLCRRMGDAARETIILNHSRSRLMAALSQICTVNPA